MTLAMDAPVVAVTVYPGQARVTRRGTVNLPAGAELEVSVDDLTQGIVPESVRVTGRGAGSITGVDVRVRHHETDESERIAALLAERQRLAVAAQEVADRRRTLDVRLTMLESLAARAGKAYANELAAGSTQVGDIRPVADQVAEQVAVVLALKRGLIDDEKAVTDAQARVDRELGQSGGPAPDRTSVVVGVAPADGGELELEVSYLVDGATWESRYDIRLEEAEVAVTWYGHVSQWSGEDWPECELRLSTARPTAGILIPELEPWYLMDRPPVQLRGAAPMAAMAMDAGAEMSRRLKAEPVAYAEAVLEEGTTAATYVIGRPVAVPTDGSGHQALITSFRLPAVLDHVTAPLRSDDVYVRATVTNTTEHTLRPGRASLFHGTEFVGVSDLDLVAPGEEVELALGLADRIRVERKLVARNVDRALLSGQAKHAATWRTTVANHGGRPAKVTVLDQIPISQHPGIKVVDAKAGPEATIDDMGQVTWTLDLPAGGTVDLTLAVKVEVQKGVAMIGWRE